MKIMLFFTLFLLGCEFDEQINIETNTQPPEQSRYFKHIIADDCDTNYNMLVVEGKEIRVCDNPPMEEITEEEREYHNNNFSQIKWYSEKELR